MGNGGAADRMVLRFGEWKGHDTSEIPLGYLQWLRSLPDLREPLRTAVADELEERKWRRRFQEAFTAGRQAREYRQAVEREAHGVDARTALEIVREGYRQLSLRHHPDRGGDTAAMQQVNAAAAWLRGTVGRMLPGGRRIGGGLPPHSPPSILQPVQ